MNHVLVAGPQSEPVSLEEAKAHLRVDHDEEDSLISDLIVAAREYCEAEAGRAWLPQTWRLSLETFPCGRIPIVLPMPPLRSVESITYVDQRGQEQTLAAEAYLVDADDDPGKVLPVYGGQWPAARCDANSVKITYVAGYEDKTKVPRRAKQAILLLVGHWYEHREGVLTGAISKEIELATRNLLAQLWNGRIR